MDSSASLWVGALAGATTGLLTSIIGHLLLDVPKVKGRVRDDLHGDPQTGVLEVQSYVEVTNIRGRPVTIEGAGFLKRGAMSTPAGWVKDLPQRLDEGGRIMFTFGRDDYPKTVPVAMDHRATCKAEESPVACSVAGSHGDRAPWISRRLARASSTFNSTGLGRRGIGSTVHRVRDQIRGIPARVRTAWPPVGVEVVEPSYPHLDRPGGSLEPMAPQKIPFEPCCPNCPLPS